LRSSPLYWDLAAADYAIGRVTFPADAGTRWCSHGDESVGIWDLGDQNGRTMLELGCGHGVALEALAVAFPNGTFKGIDFSPGQLRLASERTRHLPNVTLSLGDARLGIPAGVGPYDDLLSIYGAFDFVPSPSLLLDLFLGGLAANGTCTLLTSVLPVFESVLRCPRLKILRTSAIGPSWFVRGKVFIMGP
jgi:SAM-dependent methyltransferase